MSSIKALAFALVGRQLAEGGEQRRQRPLLAEGGDAHGVERGLVGGRGGGGEELRLKVLEIGHRRACNVPIDAQ